MLANLKRSSFTRRARALAILALTFGPAACDAQKSQASGLAGGQTTAKQLWDTILTKCGDSYYYGGSALHIIDEFRERLIDEPPPNPHKRFGNPLELSATPPATSPSPKITKAPDWNPATGWLWEYRGLTFKVAQLPISHADALNGVQWKGVLRMDSTAWRESDANGKWEKWHETAPRYDDGRIKVLAQKINGEWIYSPATPSNGDSDFNDPRLSTKVSAADLKAFSRASCGASGQGGNGR